jgi:hypothetical protein
MARLASFKMETEEDFDATRWLDRTLIRLAQVGESVGEGTRDWVHVHVCMRMCGWTGRSSG